MAPPGPMVYRHPLENSAHRITTGRRPCFWCAPRLTEPEGACFPTLTSAGLQFPVLAWQETSFPALDMNGDRDMKITLPAQDSEIDDRNGGATTFTLPLQAPVVAPRRPVPYVQPSPLPRTERYATTTRDQDIEKYRQQRTEPERIARLNVDTVTSPLEGKYKALARLDLLVADESTLAGMFGDIQLKCGRENVNMRRVSLGQMNLHSHHNTDDPWGRIVSMTVGNREVRARAEVANTTLGKFRLEEIDAGISRGVSPGFIIEKYTIEETKTGFDMTVTLWRPYEISMTSIPRNDSTRLTGRNTMTSTANEVEQFLQDNRKMVTLDDLDGL